MVLQGLNAPVRQMVYGSLSLIVCLALYLAWWCITFRPGGAGTTWYGGICILLACLAGAAGLLLIIKGIGGCPAASAGLSNRFIVMGGVIAYIVLLVFTGFVLKRTVTAELFLLVGWAVLKLSMANSLAGAGYLGRTAAIALAVVLVAAFVGSMACYLLYYNLDGTVAYFDGMVPLIAIAAYQAVVICTLLSAAQ